MKIPVRSQLPMLAGIVLVLTGSSASAAQPGTSSHTSESMAAAYGQCGASQAVQSASPADPLPTVFPVLGGAPGVRQHFRARSQRLHRVPFQDTIRSGRRDQQRPGILAGTKNCN